MSSKKKEPTLKSKPINRSGAESRYKLIPDDFIAASSLFFESMPIVNTEASKRDIGMAIFMKRGSWYRQYVPTAAKDIFARMNLSIFSIISTILKIKMNVISESKNITMNFLSTYRSISLNPNIA